MSNLTFNDKIEEFKNALQSGISGIVRASEIYVSALDDDPRNAEKFREEFAEWVPSSAWAQFEAVGRKWMHPRLLMGGVSDRRKAAIIKKLPYSLQERIFKKEKFKLLTCDGQTLNVDLMDATAEQAKQLFNENNYRDLSEQRAWVESNNTKQDSDEFTEEMPYIIKGSKVVFRKGCVLNKVELKRILQEI